MEQQKYKTPSDSAVNDYVYKIFPNDLNDQGTVFGGTVTSILDRVAVVIASRHSERVCVTASIDAVHFLAPARKGENLIVLGAITRAWNTSMEIGLKMLAEHPFTGKTTHILSAYFTFVALDEGGKPTKVPALKPVSAVEQRRFQEADHRRERRIKAAAHQAEFRKSFEKKS